MPPRVQTVHELAVHRLVGDGPFWFSYGEPDPKTGVTNDEYVAAKNQADADFEFIVEHINWIRVMGEAATRHQMLMIGGDEHHEPGDNVEGYIDSYVCGWCVRHALLFHRDDEE